MQNNGSNNGSGAGSDNGSGDRSQDRSQDRSNQGSRLPGFYKLSVEERRELLRDRADLSELDLETLDGGGLDTAAADRIVENVVGIYALPLGLGLNFRVNGRDVLVPMAVEEPSVIAAASNAARMVREGGGFVAEADDPVMTAELDGAAVRDGIVAASLFAEDDPYRAATHNKGIMNGVDAVVIATGNDWRGVEAGAHAFAAQSGRYRPLATWRAEEGDLVGSL